MSGRLDGKIALVTGGARGMGASEARLFSEEGATVIVGDILGDLGRQLVGELGGSTRFVDLDVSSESSWTAAVGSIVEEFSRIDVLVNNAGIAYFCPLVAMATDDYLRIVGVNQLGVFLGMKHVIPAMSERLNGSIVNISSIEGLAGTGYGVAYAATKFAVRGMTKVAALEVAKSGIRVNSIHPGVIRTPITEMAAPGADIDAMISPHVPMRRIGEPEEVARLALFLASDESGYCTGSEFVVDGGVMAGSMLEPGEDLTAALESAASPTSL